MKATEANITDTLLTVFPEIEQDIAEYRDLFHLQLMEIRVFIENELAKDNAEPAKRTVILLDSLLADCDWEVNNAIHVSFLEHIDRQTESGKVIYAMFTARLQDAWHAIDRYNRELLGR